MVDPLADSFVFLLDPSRTAGQTGCKPKRTNRGPPASLCFLPKKPAGENGFQFSAIFSM